MHPAAGRKGGGEKGQKKIQVKCLSEVVFPWAPQQTRRRRGSFPIVKGTRDVKCGKNFSLQRDLLFAIMQQDVKCNVEGRKRRNRKREIIWM